MVSLLDDVDRHDFIKTLADACQKTGWLAIAERLRKETTLSIKAIAARVQLGSSRSANARLHRWLRGRAATDGKMGNE